MECTANYCLLNINLTLFQNT